MKHARLLLPILGLLFTATPARAEPEALPAFADLLEELVRPEDRARPFHDGSIDGRCGKVEGRRLDKAVGRARRTEQRPNAVAERTVIAAGLFEIPFSIFRPLDFHRSGENVELVHGSRLSKIRSGGAAAS